jgi:hypothetical protein
MFYRLEFNSVLSFIDSADYAILKMWKNPSPLDGWQPLQLEYQSDAPRHHVMGLHSIMIWQAALVEALDPLLDTAYQALPVVIDDNKHFALHITQSVDCLDPVHSRFKRFKNRNIGVEHIVLRADCVGDAHLFTIPDDGYSTIFASKQLKSQFDKCGWSGVSFAPVESI